ncbi:MAG: J domain-containing protein [Pseudomonadota bacterium]
MAATPEHAARVLGLDVKTTLSEIKRARREMAFKYHPDRTDDFQRASRHMARINAAADTLTAHVLDEAGRLRQRKRNRYADFSHLHRNPGKAQAPEQKEAPKTASARDANAAQKDTQTVEQPALRKRVRPKRLDQMALLAQFASAAYAQTLAHIGVAVADPVIDVRLNS